MSATTTSVLSAAQSKAMKDYHASLKNTPVSKIRQALFVGEAKRQAAFGSSAPTQLQRSAWTK